MKPALVGALLGVAVAVGSLWSCTINRPSEALKCSSQNDCTQHPGTICNGGYCVVGMIDAAIIPPDAFECPAACNGGCDPSASPPICTITGTGTGNITCPAGFRCNIACAQTGACGQISCGDAVACDVDCIASGACIGISCEGANCDVTCTGPDACGNITCTSGTCNALCTGEDACEQIQCTTGTCTATCTGGSGMEVCGNMDCSASGNCTRTCEGSGACAAMSCTTGDCTQTCSGGQEACGPITSCGTGACTATCTGFQGACGDINCASSCDCRVDCNDIGGDVCPNMACPDPQGGQADECEDSFGRCDSTLNANRCQKCT